MSPCLRSSNKENVNTRKNAGTGQEGKSAVSPSKKRKVEVNLDEVRRLLHTSEVPEKLPCREKEYEEICSFIEGTVRKNGRSQAMYISGVPGTGKTATVVQAIQKLEKVYGFKSAFVNAMELTDPKRIFLNIYNELFGSKQKVSASDARRKLNSYLVSGALDESPVCAILVIDELDSLCKSRQEIVYDIFNWTENNCQVGIIAIANTFDLREQFLARRIASRMNIKRLQFQPYKRQELESIIKYRLQNSNALEDDALELASRRIAIISGDLRKALDIVTRAAQIALDGKQKRIDLKSVFQALRETSCDIYVEYVEALSLHSRLLLRASLSVKREQDNFLFCDLYEEYERICHELGLAPIPSRVAYSNAMEMCSSHILVAAPGINNWTRRFRLGMSRHEACSALSIAEENKNE